jgi:hemolysin activation/secretion protein
VNGSVSYGNLFQRGDTIAAQFQVAPERTADTLVFSGSYLYHVPGTPIALVASYLHSNSNVSTLGSTTVVGRGDDAGLHSVIPLGTDGEFVHSADIGIDYKRFYEADTFGNQTTLAPLTWYPVSAAYNAAWAGERATTNLSASVAFTFAGLGSNTTAYQVKRAYATSNFVVLRGSVDHTQTVWQGVAVSARAAAQVAPQALIENEQFSLGGLDTVRGYLEGSVLGDSGAAVQTELRSPELPRRLAGAANEIRGFAFFDAGGAQIDNALPGQAHSYALTSTGMGMRARVFDSFSGEILGAYPFASVNGTKAGSPRILFRISAGL